MMYLIMSVGSGHIAVATEHDLDKDTLTVGQCPGGQVVGVLVADVDRGIVTTFPLKRASTVISGDAVIVWLS